MNWKEWFTVIGDGRNAWNQKITIEETRYQAFKARMLEEICPEPATNSNAMLVAVKEVVRDTEKELERNSRVCVCGHTFQKHEEMPNNAYECLTCSCHNFAEIVAGKPKIHTKIDYAGNHYISDDDEPTTPPRFTEQDMIAFLVFGVEYHNLLFGEKGGYFKTGKQLLEEWLRGNKK